MTTTQVLVGHDLAVHGLTFVCTEYGTARNFGTIEAAMAHIREHGLNDFLPIWQVMIVTVAPMNPIGKKEAHK